MSTYYQVGGRRKKKNGTKQLLIRPMQRLPDGRLVQVGGAFWSDAVNWVKDKATKVGRVLQPLVKPAVEAIKKSGVVGDAIGMLPGVGGVGKVVARQYGWGEPKVVVPGNAALAAH